MNGVTPVLLGLLSFRPMSGYDMKRIVDHSTRFFWAVSYGQIYPELRRLEADGLVTSESPSGGRRRKLYRLTDAGQRALDEWLRVPGAGYELRDLGLLKLFFSSTLPTEDGADLVRRLRDDRARVLERLREIEATAPPHAGGATLTLRFGIATHEFWVDWLEQLERELRAEAALEEGVA